ncbi:MAG: hypothetical protein IGQ88_12550 [Gloeomargaritaceae cyanobacterium C42_A2020_066]|nr:hypothetical protein [Gloeomargaritaceae cyanobacterium C42_A2020_066]
MAILLNSFIEKTNLLEQTEIDKVRLLAFYHHSHQEDFEFSVDIVCDWFEKLGLHKPNKFRLKQNLSKSRSFVKGRAQEFFRLHANELNSLKRDHSLSNPLDEESTVEQEEIAAVAEEEQEKLASANERELQIPNTFGEWLHGFKDDINDLEKAPITAYYVQKQSPQNDFKTSEVNKFLQDHGVKLSNPSNSLTRLAEKKLLFQTRKNGKLKYMRISSDGVNHLKSLRRWVVVNK